MAAIAGGVAIIRGASLAVMHNDVEYVFRQDSDFFYLTGFNEPNAVAVLAPHHPEHQFILFVPPKNPAQEVWTGYRAGVEGAIADYGAHQAHSIEDLTKELPQYLEKADALYYHFGRDQAFNQTMITLWQQLTATYPRKGYGPRGILDPNRLLHRQRQRKSAAEIAMLREAGKISAAAHVRAMEVAQPGMYEYEVQSEINHFFQRQGTYGEAYPSIVAAGANACVLHYIENRTEMADGDLLLIDAGCSHGYYNGDITRTFPINGKFSPEQKALYEIVLEAQRQAIAQVQPGNPYNQFHDAAVTVLVEGLKGLKLLQGSTEELIATHAYRPFYMHRTGHWLGLDVHDVGAYKTGDGEDSWVPLQAGNVVTVEPGLYISPTIEPVEGQPEIPDRWRGIGIRIEDDVLVTASGQEILTGDVPKAIADLEGY